MKTRKQQKDLRNLRTKIRTRKQNATGRFFLDQSDLGEARWNESIEFSRAKKEKIKLAGVIHKAWSCGCCFTAHGKIEVKACLAKQPKSQRKPEVKSTMSCVHFRGKVK